MTECDKQTDRGQSEADDTEDEVGISKLSLTRSKFQDLLKNNKDSKSIGENLTASAKARSCPSANRRKTTRTRLYEYELSNRIGERVWKTSASELDASERTHSGNVFEDS